MNSEGGYALIYRRVLDDPDFASPAEALAFVYLILKASWRDCAVRYKDRRISLKRGQLAVSVRDMADDLEWSKSRCDRFISGLKKRDKIGTSVGTGVTVITVCKYDEYQLEPGKSGTPPEPEAGHQRDTSGTQNNEGNKSSPNGAPLDLKTRVWREGKSLLLAKGTPERQTGGIVGRWLKMCPDEAALLAIIGDARDRAEPQSWVPAAIAARTAEPAHSLDFLTQVTDRYAGMEAQHG